MTTEGKINRYKFFSYYEETAYKLKDNHFLSLKSGSIFFFNSEPVLLKLVFFCELSFK